MAQGKLRTEAEKQKILTKLIPILQSGTSLYRACEYCKIPYTSVRSLCEKDEGFRLDITEAVNYLQVLAEKNLANKIAEGDVDTSKWVLERKLKKEYSQKIENELSSDPQNPPEFIVKFVD